MCRKSFFKMSDFGRVSENRMIVHSLEANLKGIYITRHQFLSNCIMGTESLKQQKDLKLRSSITVEFLVYEKMVPEEFTLVRKIFTPAMANLNNYGHLVDRVMVHTLCLAQLYLCYLLYSFCHDIWSTYIAWNGFTAVSSSLQEPMYSVHCTLSSCI